jgi:hypothetical protein
MVHFFPLLNLCMCAVSFVVRIPARTYPGQTDSAKNFKSIARLVARNVMPRELLQILVYHIVTQVLLSRGWIGNLGEGKWVWYASAVPRLVLRSLRASA